MTTSQSADPKCCAHGMPPPSSSSFANYEMLVEGGHAQGPKRGAGR